MASVMMPLKKIHVPLKPFVSYFLLMQQGKEKSVNQCAGMFCITKQVDLCNLVVPQTHKIKIHCKTNVTAHIWTVQPIINAFSLKLKCSSCSSLSVREDWLDFKERSISGCQQRLTSSSDAPIKAYPVTSVTNYPSNM